MLNLLFFAASTSEILAILSSSNLNGSTMPAVSVFVLAVQLVGASRLTALNSELFVVRIFAIDIFTISLRAFTRAKFPGDFLAPCFGFKF